MAQNVERFPVLERFDHVQACTSTRTGGVSSPPYDTLNLAYHVGDDPASVATNRRIFCEQIDIPLKHLVLGEQVHGTCVQFVSDTRQSGDVIPATDGLLTSVRGISVGILTADCIPVFLAIPHHGIVGLLHAGWRGIWGDILGKALAILNEHADVLPSQVHIALGPGIGPCCYEVGSDLAQKFRVRLGNHVIRNQRFLDLHQILRTQCLLAGIPASQVECHIECTACSSDKYFSHRASSGRTGRMMSVIRLR